MPCSRLRSGISRSTNRQLLSESANTSHEGAHSKEGGNKQAISAPEGIIENIIDKVKMKTEDINSPVPPLQAVPTSCVAAEEAGSELATWTSILNNIKAFMGVAGQIDDIRPYAKVVWSVISAIPKIINTQLETDKSMAKLVKAIDDTFITLCDAKCLELHNVTSRVEMIKLIVQQTTESAVLLYDYLQTSSLWARTLSRSLSDVQSVFQQHVITFERLRQEFIHNTVAQSKATPRIDITTVRALKLVQSTPTALDKHVTRDYLEDMHYVHEAQCVSDKRCLPGTRESIISDITDWAYDYTNGPETRAGIFLLTGVAGCGKSAIAHEIAHRFADMHRLGSSFCFDASRQATRSPNYLFSTISGGFARLDAHWKEALVAALQEPYAEPSTLSQRKQIKNFLQRPSEKLHFVGPIVIVIDALDESGSRITREELMSNIINMSKILPPNFRFLITTRAEEDIMATLPNQPNVKCVDLVSIDAASTSSDIRHLIEAELSSDPRTLGLLEKAYPNRVWLTRLANSSQNLFQWATTACRFITERKAGQSVLERLEILLEDKGMTGSPLDSIYIKVFSSVCDVGTPGSKKRQQYQTALGLVLAIREPLTLSALTTLLADNPDAVKAIGIYVPSLGSLFRGGGLDGIPIRPLHTSLPDFLTDPRRSGDYYVQPDRENDLLAQASLQQIAKGPQFNICRIKDSYFANKDTPSFNEKSGRDISPALSYAHRFWDAHVCECTNATMIRPALDLFLDRSVLVWLEVLAWLRMVNTVGMRVRQLRRWNHQQKDGIVDSIFEEVERFVSMCGSAISYSTPHLYLSALAFVPRQSFIYKQYTKRYSHALRVTNIDDIRWPQCLLRLNAVEEVTDIAISPDGRMIASAQGDHIWFWDAATGEQVGDRLVGNLDGVNAIAFSPDGKTLVSGSLYSTIRLWNTATGQPIRKPFYGHTAEVQSVSFSPKETKIVSGSSDNTVMIWDTSTQACVSVLKGHSDAVRSVAFSPDGTQIVSGSADMTIRLWNSSTGGQIGFPLIGHEGGVNSVGFSPDGKTVVSGSDDRTIRMWDVATQTSLGGPLAGHSKTVDSVSFSADGLQLISSSADSNIWVWDVTQRQAVDHVLTGHRGRVISVAFPADGQKVVSGSADGTIGVWDVTTGGSMSESAVALSGAVWSVAFSPDARRLASGLSDGTIRQWDSTTGKSIGNPLIGHSDAVWSVVFSADGRTLVSGSADSTVMHWDAATGKVIQAFHGHTKEVRSVGIAPDGRWIISGSLDGTVLRWNAATGERDGKFVTRTTEQVKSVAFSPNGKTVLAELGDGTLRLWNAITTEPIASPLAHKVRSVAFSPDGEQLVTGGEDFTVCIWKLKTGQLVGGPLTGHTSSIQTVAFSLDGGRIVSGSHDGIVRQWDTTTQEPIDRPLAHPSRILCAAISPDAQQIVVGTQDRSLRSWRTSTKTDASFYDTTAAFGNVQRLPYTDSSLMEDGWMLGFNRELLFWIAPDYRSALRKPGNKWVISGQNLELELSQFAHGPSWTGCRG
ncbi:WD40 repeat-like protein [Trametopsis cervina]|nr:WD40 repeat-like protein [Trametopsis cervina]